MTLAQVLQLVGATVAGLVVGVAGIAAYESVTGDEDGAPPGFVDATATATAGSPTQAASPTPTSPPTVDRCIGADARIQELSDPIASAMDGYNGEWGFALIDADCDAMVEYPAGYSQYPASSWKIVIVIAALRAVEAGELELEQIEEHLELVLQHSFDANTDAINAFVTLEQLNEVTEIAGISALTTYEKDWRYTDGTPLDLARVWAALLRGDLLSEEWTDYLLELAETAEFPNNYETFPPAPLDTPGYQYGQKAGFYISENDPHYLIGAGYIRPDDGRSDGFALVLMAVTPMRDVSDPQRREVFPILLEYILGELEPVAAP